jgi:hypothetical protein
MAVHKNRTNKRHLRAKRHASHARKVSRSRKGGFGDEETNDAGDPKFDRDIEMGVTDADVAESSAESDAELMETGSTMYSPEIKGDEMVGGKQKKSRRHSKKRKAHKTHKRRHGRKHSKSHKKK